LDIPLLPLQLGILYKAWFRIIPGQQVPKGGQIHLWIQISPTNTSPFQGFIPQDQPLTFHLKAVEATDVPQMDLGGKADPYVEFNISNKARQLKTTCINSTLTPKWDQEFHVDLFSTDTQLDVQMKDQDLLTDDLISSREINLYLFQPLKVYDLWLVTYPSNKAPSKSFPMLHLIIHLAPKGQAFVDCSNPYIGPGD
jgi:hypothetical protein